ncbi:hypothetical protein PMAYCL1PPCAC_27645, partial [Pristionchus mayeri]
SASASPSPTADSHRNVSFSLSPRLRSLFAVRNRRSFSSSMHIVPLVPNSLLSLEKILALIASSRLRSSTNQSVLMALTHVTLLERLLPLESVFLWIVRSPKSRRRMTCGLTDICVVSLPEISTQIVAAVCATADDSKCGCAPLEQLSIPGKRTYAVVTDRVNPC